MKKEIPKGLYVVTEEDKAKNRSNEDIVRAAIKGGAKIIQLREKHWSKEEYKKEAIKLLNICRKHSVLFIVNDYPDIAKEIGADGIHVGQDDTAIKKTREIVGDIIIGTSNHTVEQALHSQKEGADYISIGPIFTTNKRNYTVGPELIDQVKPHLTKPIVAIGGINKNNIDQVVKKGATAVAVISAVVNAEDPELAAKELCRKIELPSK